jgi:hypothetical protein
MFRNATITEQEPFIAAMRPIQVTPVNRWWRLPDHAAVRNTAFKAEPLQIATITVLFCTCGAQPNAESTAENVGRAAR